MINEARHGMTVATLARILNQYARDNPDAIVKFSSCESGGNWPASRGPMFVFTDHQIGMVDRSRIGGETTMDIALLKKES